MSLGHPQPYPYPYLQTLNRTDVIYRGCQVRGDLRRGKQRPAVASSPFASFWTNLFDDCFISISFLVIPVAYSLPLSSSTKTAPRALSVQQSHTSLPALFHWNPAIGSLVNPPPTQIDSQSALRASYTTHTTTSTIPLPLPPFPLSLFISLSRIASLIHNHVVLRNRHACPGQQQQLDRICEGLTPSPFDMSSPRGPTMADLSPLVHRLLQWRSLVPHRASLHSLVPVPHRVLRLLGHPPSRSDRPRRRGGPGEAHHARPQVVPLHP